LIPGCFILIEFLPWGPAGIEIFCQITSAPLAKNISVVCWWADRNGFRGSPVEIAQVMRETLDFVGAELHFVKDYDIVSGLCLQSNVSDIVAA